MADDLFLAGLQRSVTGREIAATDWPALGMPPIAAWPQALRTSLSLMLACPTPMFLAWGPELRCFYNDAYRPIFGFRLDTALGRPFADVWASIWDDIGPLVRTTLAGETSTMVDMQLDLAREGLPEESWWTFTYSPAFDDDGAIAGLFCVTGETTSRIVAERELAAINRSLEQRVRERTAERDVLAKIFELTDAFVHVVDLDYNWLAVNQSGAEEFERVFGALPKAGDNMLASLHRQEDRDEVQAFWGRALAGEEFTATAQFGDAADWRRKTYEMKFNALYDEDGKRIGAFQVVTDVTARERASSELEQARETMRQGQKLEAIGQLTGGVAHDFNNLLTVIRGSVELLQRADISPERQRRYIDAIGDTAERATRLTNQLLAFSRRQSLKPEPFDLGRSVDDLRDIVVTLSGSRITVDTVTPADAVYVMADRSQLDTAIINMAVNARDAMPGGGALRIAVGAVSGIPALRGHKPVAGEFVAVTIGDTGEGIPADQLARIFEPFYTTKDVGAGTGLGLSQVFGFAKQSGGNVGVESVVGGGACFTLYLPRAPHPDAPAIDEPDDVPVDGEGVCVLVVEDNPQVGDFAQSALAELGYESVLAVDAAAALAVLAAEPARFDVVFTDVVMPGMSGVELGEEVRRLYPGLPLILASGYSHVLAQNGQHGFELLHKPYSIEQLSRVLRKSVGWRQGRG